MPVIDGFREQGAAPSGVIEGFRPQSSYLPELESPRPKSRSALAFANDTVVTGLNSALGIGKAVSDFISVDNPVSRGLQYVIDEGEKTYSDQTRADREALNQAIDAGGWDAAKGVGRFIVSSPVQAAAMAAGNFAPFGAVIKGARGLATLGGLGATGVGRVGIGSASALGGAAAGGDAAGDAYAQVMRSPNVDPEVKEELARQAAREASVVPAIIGAATPFLPGSAESQLARGLGLSRMPVWKPALSEFGQEFVEEGATKLSANLAAQQYDPAIDASRGVFGSALLGGALGAGTGATIGYINNRAVQADLLATREREEAQRAFDAPGPSTTLPEGFFDRIDTDNEVGLGIVRPINPYDAAGYVTAFEQGQDTEVGSPQQGLFGTANFDAAAPATDLFSPTDETSATEAPTEAPTQAPTEAPAPAAPSVFSPEEQELISIGVKPTPAAKTLWTQAKATDLTENELSTVGSELAKNYGAGKKALQSILIARNNPAAAPAAAPVAAPPQAPLNPNVGGTPPSPAVGAAPTPSLTTPPALAAVPAAPAVGAATPAATILPTAQATAGAPTAVTEEPVVQRKRRVVDPASLQQSQAFVAPETNEQQEQTEAPVQDAGLSFEDQLAAAQATGNAGEIQAEADELSGRRMDTPVVNATEEEREAAVSEVLKLRFANSKNPQRDAEIARAYWVALRDAPQNSKLKVQEAIGAQFGVKPVRVRQAGNPTAMVEAGKALGYSQEQVLEMLGVNDNSKKAAVGVKAANEDEATPNIASALKQAGVETSEEDGVGFGLDDDRAYTGAAFDSSGRPTYGDVANARTELLHNSIFSLTNKIDQLRATAAELTAQGKPEVAAKIAQEQGRVEAALAKMLEKAAAQKKPAETAAPTPTTGPLSEEAKAASAKFKAAKLDLNAMDDSELPALREGAARFNNKALMAQIDRRMGVEPTVVEDVPAQVEDESEGRLVLDREKAAAAWDRAAVRSEGAIPSFEELTDEQQATFIGFGDDNWKLADINKFADEEGLVNEVQANDDRSDDLKFGKDRGTGAVKNGYKAAELTDEIKKYIRADVLGRKLVVVDTVGDLLNSRLPAQRAVGAQISLENAYGVASDGTAYLVADRIKKGSGRAKFMHEVGGHLGLDNLLPKAVFDRLVDQIKTWARRDDGSVESELAQAALKRTMDANTPKADQRSEFIAYFLEEAVERGIDPTAETVRGSSALREWFRTLWAAFKVAARRLGIKPESLTAQDVVNMAFGAARLEIAGTWHGTAAEVETLDGRKLPFRRFDNRKVGSGEGAQAYGWGTYLAQRFGVGKRYFEADVQRKTTSEQTSVKYDGVEAGYIQEADLNEVVIEVMERLRSRARTLPQAIEAVVANRERELAIRQRTVDSARKNNSPGLADLEETLQWLKDALAAAKSLDPAKFEVVMQKANQPEGALLRVDVAAKPDELMVWEEPVNQQPAGVQAVLKRIPFAPGWTPTNTFYNKYSTGHLYAALARKLAKYDLVVDPLAPDGPYKFVPKPKSQHVQRAFSLLVDGQTVDYTGNPKAASEWLDSMGVKGVTHTDAPSRSNQKVYQNYKKQRDLKAAFDSIPTDVKTKFSLRSALDLAQDIEMVVSSTGPNGNDPARVVKNLGLADAAADAVYEYADWLQEKTGNVIVFNDKNVFRVGAQVGGDAQRMRFGKNRVEKLPAELQKPVATVTNVLNDTKNAALNTLTFTEDVINRAVDLGMQGAAKLRTIYQQRAALTGKLERDVERVADLYNRVPERERGTGDQSVNKFLYDSTREGKWGFKPSWRKGPSANVEIDKDTEARFDALSKESKALVEAIFRHGDDVLAIKKQTVVDATESEFDDMIAQAKKANETEKVNRLTAEKASTLKRFSTLFSIQEFKPYAPLKRFGKYVVVARSQQYIDGDEKTRAKLEDSEDHYHVSFAESAAAAREMVDQLQKQGAFAEVVFRQKEAENNDMAGGALSAFNRLRKTLDAELAEAPANEKSAVRAARKVVGELYLSTLAESSARKSEMRRKGVAGEIDMLRSFTTQGRADAQFIAGAKFSSETLDAFNAMRKEVRSGDSEAQNTKSGVFNELLKRQSQSMDYDPTPIADKLARLSSIWYLATSPAYYLQNLLQPWVLSLPVMAGRHNWFKVANALTKAYTDLRPMFRTVKLGEQFNYDAAPADVRKAISTLVDRGRIDIGMETDLGTFQVEGQGVVKDRVNKVDRGFRNFAQKMEAINRLSTAIAAYRVELAKTGSADKALEYADSIISQTHGDYTRINAPRAFNTAPGKVMLQFRKFQLIQLSLLAKLLKNSFTGSDQQVARKMLAFTLSHTAVLAGAIGLPGFAAISWALKGLFGDDDDEPFNAEKKLRELIGNEELATLLTRGVPAALGVDLSSKLGMGNVLSILPFNDLDLSNRSGVESAGFSLIGGPAGGLTSRAADGLGLIRNGEYHKGLEQLLPTGFSNAMKAYRFFNDGVTRRNGDVLISPDEISGMDTFWQAIGLQPTQLALRQSRETIKREADDKFKSRTDRIRNAYLRSRDDPEARAEAREKWLELQDVRERAGYKRQPLSSLIRSEQEQRKRERNTIEGIQFDRRNRRFIADLVEEEPIDDELITEED